MPLYYSVTSKSCVGPTTTCSVTATTGLPEPFSIEDEIIVLERRLKLLKLQRKGAFPNYAHLTMYDMPDDVLSEIFLQCLPTGSGAGRMEPESAPLLLGRVCRRWRDVAYTLTPVLWSTLYVAIPLHPSPLTRINSWDPEESYRNLRSRFLERVAQHQEAVKAWLVRSGGTPLSISLHPVSFAQPIEAHHHEGVSSYLRILMQHSERWRDVNLTVFPGDESTLVASISQADVPALERLHVKLVGGGRHDTSWPNSDLFNAPKLNSLSLSHVPHRAVSLGVAWAQLSSLTILDCGPPSRNTGMSLREAYFILKACNNLHHCDISIADDPSSTLGALEVLDASVISLPFLESFSVIDGCRHLVSLISKLHLPALRKISYHTTIWHSARRVSPLIALLNGVGGQLETITTDIRWCFTSEQLCAFLNMASGLTQFTNSLRVKPSLAQLNGRGYLPADFNIMRAFLDVLTPSHSGHVYLPRLRVIEFKDGLNVPEARVLTFIQSRMEEALSIGLPSLEIVNVEFLREREIDIMPLLETQIASGLKVVLVHPTSRIRPPGIFRPGTAANSLGQGTHQSISSWRGNMIM